MGKLSISPQWSAEAQTFFSNSEVKALLRAPKPARSLCIRHGRIKSRTCIGEVFRSMGVRESGEFQLRIGELISELQSCPELRACTTADQLTPELRLFAEAVHKLFFRRLARLPERLFDRSAIVKHGPSLFSRDPLDSSMDGEVLRFYLDRIEPGYTLRDYYEGQAEIEQHVALQKELLEASDLSDRDRLDVEADLNLLRDTHTLQLLLRERRLAERLGLAPKPAKGSTGTLLHKGVEGLLGVSKFPTRERSLRKQIERYYGQLSHLSPSPLAQVEAEVFAYRVWQMSGLEEFGVQVPPSMLVGRNREEPYLFMMSLYLHLKQQLGPGRELCTEAEVRSHTYEAQCSEAQSMVPSIKAHSRSEYSEEELTRLQVFAGFDFYLFNFDRHRENWWVYSEDGAHPDQIACIDTAHIMPRDHGEKGLIEISRHNLLLQKEMQFAKEPLTDEARACYRRLADQNQTHVHMAYNELPGYLTKDILRLFRLRREVLLAASEDPDMTFERLGKLSTTKRMAAYVGG